MPSPRAFNAAEQGEQCEEYVRARNAKACQKLLGLLVKHHSQHCPSAASEYMRMLDPEPDVPEPVVVHVQTEEDRIAEWVEKQKKLLPPKFRDWDVESAFPSVLSIQREVCKYYNISRADLVSTRRTKNVMEPRHVAIYLSRKLTTRSLPYIGGKFGGRDHTTALHSVQMVEQRMARDPAFAERVRSMQAGFQEIAEAAE